MIEPHQLNANDIIAGIARGEFSARSVIESCLARIDDRENLIKAWTVWSIESAYEKADAIDRGEITGSLAGLPIAVKDLIDTKQFATSYGSPIFASNHPSRSARIVQRLEEMGAVVVGKTATTEFAYFEPAKTNNPNALGHTPGGSSSGSAAAVADFHVPVALATQTAGSIIRPASYCGVFGFKPSFNRYPSEGVFPLAPSMDTVGMMARSIDDLRLIDGALTGYYPDREVHRPRRVFVSRLGVPVSQVAEQALRAFCDQIADIGITVEELDLPRAGDLIELHTDLFAHEANKCLRPIVEAHPASVSNHIKTLVEKGAAVPSAILDQAEREQQTARQFFSSKLEADDLLLTYAAPGDAPEGFQFTGDPVCSRLWSLLRMPCVSIPVGRSPEAFPVGVQLVGQIETDRRFLAGVAGLLRAIDEND